MIEPFPTPTFLLCDVFVVYSRLHQELRIAVESQLNTMQQSNGLSAQTQMQLEDMKRQISTIHDV